MPVTLLGRTPAHGGAWPQRRTLALICLEKQCSGVFRGFLVVFSWLFRGFFVALILGKFYAYSPWNSLLTPGPFRDQGFRPWSRTPPSTENPKKRVFWVWGAHFWIWSRRPRDQGVGVDPGLLIYAEPLKSLGQKGKTLKEARKFPATKISKEIQKSKERKIRGYPPISRNTFSR